MDDDFSYCALRPNTGDCFSMCSFRDNCTSASAVHAVLCSRFPKPPPPQHVDNRRGRCPVLWVSRSSEVFLLRTGGALSDVRYGIRLRSEMAQQDAAHLFRLLRRRDTKNKLHSSTGLRCFFITLEASKRGFYLVAKQLVYPDCSELHGVSKRLQGQLRPVCGFAAPL